MKKLCLSVVLAVLTIAVAGVSTSRAAMVTTLNSNGNTYVDFSNTPSEVDGDIFWVNTDFVLLQVTLESGDTSPLAFSSNIFNFSTTENWTDFHIQLEGNVTWAEVNSISPTPDSVVSTASAVDLFFAPPLSFSASPAIVLGDPNA